MTYSRFLLLFLCLPIAVMLIALRGRLTRPQTLALLVINAIAFAYTTPWDNYAARAKLWSFAPAFVWGKPLWFGTLPLEEYLFYFAEAVFVCLALVLLSRVPMLRPDPEPDGA